jgi:hypothetical protein
MRVLEIEKVGINDNFFDLGGHSLLVIRVQSQIEAAIGRRIEVVDVFQNPTIKSLAGHLDAQANRVTQVDAGRADQIQAGKERLAQLRSRAAARRGV